jgi:nucleotidyltransferase substrate binding protein (TIGR01987 family)
MNLNQLRDALARLGEMLQQYEAKESQPPLLRDAIEESLLQRFEYSLEVAWKSTKRYLVEVQGYDQAMGPKMVLRIAGELNLLDTAVWLTYLTARQAIAHDYSEAKAEAVLPLVADFYAATQRLYQTLQQRLDQDL